MLLPLVVTSLLAAQPASPAVGVDLLSDHPARALDEGVYLHVVAAPFRARAKKAPGADALEIDVVRFGPARGPTEGAAAILVELPGQTSTIPIRAPLDPKRTVGDGLLASYPVRHRFPLPEGVVDVVITVVQGGSGVGVQVRTSPATDDDLVPLVPLEPLPPDGAATSDTADASAKPSAAPADETARATPTEVTEVHVPVERPPGDEPPADVTADVSGDVSGDVKLPARFTAQVGVGGMWQVTGGLAPTLLSGGVRALTGVREGWLSRYALGAGLDFEHQSARTAANAPRSARWSATATRLRLEAQAEVLALDLDLLPLDLTLLGGAGMILGAHTFDVNGANQSALLLGPTFRIGAQAGLRLGPGAIVALVPVDLSFDAVAGRVQGFAPLAASLYLGYRLDL